MMNKKGFTLTEILLAVMIVGIIGVALASLTTAASRESGVGRSKVMLRNNLSLAMRRLRMDVHDASRVLYKKGVLDGTLSERTPLLALGKNLTLSGEKIGSADPRVVLYCFDAGSMTTTTSGATVVPAGSTDGGVIYRFDLDYKNNYSHSGGVPSCPSSGGEEILTNVKYIPLSASSEYPVPYIGDAYNAETSAKTNIGSLIYVNIITELPSNPVVNDVIQEDLALRNGFSIDED